MGAGYKNLRTKFKKSPGRSIILYIYKKKNSVCKNSFILIYPKNGGKFHTPSKLCFQSTGNNYHHILDALAGYKKLRTKFKKKVPVEALYYIYKKKKKLS